MSRPALVVAGPDPTPAQVVALIERHCRDIEAVTEPREAVQLVKQADAIKHLAQKAEVGEKLQDQAAEMVLRARRRAGEILARMPKDKGGDAKKRQSQSATSAPPSLKDLGVTKSDSSRWQAMASMPKKEFEAHITTARRGHLSTAGVVKAAEAHRRANSPAAPDVPLPGDVRTDRLSLLHGDFRDRLDELESHSVDIIVTDPPWQDLPLYSALAKMAAELLAPRGMLFVWTGQMWLPEVLDRLGEHLTYGWMFALLEPGPGTTRVMGRKIYKAWRPVLAFTTGTWPAGKWGRDVLSFSREKDLYEWQKPVAAARLFIERYCPKDGLVVDPFMGVASFGLAANEAKRRFVGVELDRGRFTQSCERLGVSR